MTERPYPSNVEAEKAVLGAMMMDPTSAGSLGLVSEDFYLPSHRAIHLALLRLVEARQDTSDVVLLSAELDQTGDLERVGGVPYLVELVDACGAPAMGPHYANVVQREAYKRRLLAESQRLIESIGGDGDPLQESVDRLRVACEEPVGRLPSREEMGRRWREDYSRGTLPYLPTPLPMLDEKVGGLPLGATTILAGRPSAGKTATALCCAVAQAMGHPVKEDDGIPVLYQSCESTRSELYQRAMCQLSWMQLRGLSAEQAESALLLDDVIKRRAPIDEVNDWSRWLDSIPVHIVRDTTNLHRMLAQARQYVHRHGVRAIYLDLINRVNDPTIRGKDVRRRVIERTVHLYSELSKELGVAVVLLAQLNRDAEGIMEPTLARLKQAGEIEEDADVVLMLARRSRKSNWGRCTIRKNRDGIADAGFTYDFIGRHVVVREDTDGRPWRQRMKETDDE